VVVCARVSVQIDIAVLLFEDRWLLVARRFPSNAGCVQVLRQSRPPLRPELPAYEWSALRCICGDVCDGWVVVVVDCLWLCWCVGAWLFL